MSEKTPSQSSSERIAVDPNYRLRDNQFWYSDCAFADLIRDKPSITLLIAGLGVRTLTHAKGSTRSFRLPTPEDRHWWEQHRGQHAQVDLLSIADEVTPPAPKREKPNLSVFSTKKTTREPNREVSRKLEGTNVEGTTLCIGLDIAWFGGSAGKPDSQYDCLASVLIQPGDCMLKLTRIRLPNRDPQATLLLEAIADLQSSNPNVKIVFSIDAPIQSKKRDALPERKPVLVKGEVERRACERFLSEQRKAIDDRAGGGANNWHPNVLSGAPLAPRVKHLLLGLSKQGFELWMPQRHSAKNLVIECFPAEAIWAMKRMGQYSDSIEAREAKEYKEQSGNQLTTEQVRQLVHAVLDSFSAACGEALWGRLVNAAIDWMIEDQTWRRTNGLYRGGKLLDDVVDTMICLATSLSYARGGAHVWYDSEHHDDGHIMGPGFHDGGNWFAACSVTGNESKP